MSRIARIVVVALLAVLGLSAQAYAQGSSGDQYGPGTGVNTTPTVTGEGPVTTTPTTTTPDTPDEEDPTDTTDGETPDGEVEDETASGTTSTGSTSGTANGGNAPTSPAGSELPGNRVTVLSFGLITKKLKADIEEALRRAGLIVLFEGNASKKDYREFLESDEAKALADGGPRAIGKAFGSQLVQPTPAFTTAFPVLFPETRFVPVIRAVLTRRDGIGEDEEEFLLGVAEGLIASGIPVAFVERTDTDPSHAKDYKDIELPVVDDVDTDKGKAELGRILLGQGSTVKPDTASALVTDARSGDGDGAGSAAIVGLLALLAAGGLWTVTAHRRRGSRS